MAYILISCASQGIISVDSEQFYCVYKLFICDSSSEKPIVRMSNKPLSVSAYLQEGLPQRNVPPGISIKNRFSMFNRDRSASQARGSSHARKESPFKRPRIDDGEDSDDGSGKRLKDRNTAFKSMAEEEENVSKAKDIVISLKRMMEKATDMEISAPMKSVLSGIIEWMDITTGVQVATASVVVDSFAKVVASPPRKSRSVGRDKNKGVVENVEATEKDEKRRKFVNEVKEAEKCMLLFKTNMGAVPVMNPETMRNRFTADLSAKAAAVEDNGAVRPSKNVVAQLDDALSMISRVEYFGKVTKKATKLNEEKVRVPDDFFTIPVKLCFKDKETRDSVEYRMRTLCKIYGTVPYHRTLRNAINRIQDEAKIRYPNNWIQVRLVPNKMMARISRRDRDDGIWHDDVEEIELPESVLDLSREAGRPARPESRPNDTEVTGGEMVQG